MRARHANCSAFAMPPSIVRYVLTLLVITAGLARSQTPAAAPKFEVASIKPCSAAAAGGGGREGGGQPLRLTSRFTSAGRVRFECATVAGLIQFA
jgi:hypothetical protein